HTLRLRGAPSPFPTRRSSDLACPSPPGSATCAPSRGCCPRPTSRPTAAPSRAPLWATSRSISSPRCRRSAPPGCPISTPSRWKKPCWRRITTLCAPRSTGCCCRWRSSCPNTAPWTSCACRCCSMCLCGGCGTASRWRRCCAPWGPTIRIFTLSAKRDFVLACLFGCQQALAVRRRSHSHTVKSVAMKVREYVDAEYCSNALSLESVAAYVHKTPAYISRVFKNELGCNFSDYLTEKRMRLAAQLLAQPDGKVYRIAAQCGYADTSNFIRVFKRFYGVSPAEYRAVQGGAE